MTELLKQYSEDIPEVGIEIVINSADIAHLVTKVCASTERKNSSLLNNSIYFVCHLTVIDIKQIQTTVTLSPKYSNVTGCLVQSSSW